MGKNFSNIPLDVFKENLLPFHYATNFFKRNTNTVYKYKDFANLNSTIFYHNSCYISMHAKTFFGKV